MKRKKYIYVLFIIATMFFSCDANQPRLSDFVIDEIYKKWIHSFEEDSSNNTTYRPEDYKTFPAARYRRTITFLNNKTCKILVLKSDDFHLEEEFNWEIDPGEKSLVIHKNNALIAKYKIKTLNNKLLVLVPYDNY